MINEGFKDKVIFTQYIHVLYDVNQLGQHWFRLWLAAWRQAITWTMSSLKSQWQTCEWLKSIWCSLPPGSVMECKRNSIAQSPPVVMIICKKTITLNTREWVSEWVSGSVSQSVSQSVGQSVRSGQVSQVCQVSQVSQSVSQGYFTAIGTTLRLSQCQWSNPRPLFIK